MVSKEFEHFKLRLLERYNLIITRKEYNSVCEQPQLTDALTVERQKDDTQLTAILYFKNKEIVVVYSFKRKCFTTALPTPKRKTCK